MAASVASAGPLDIDAAKNPPCAPAGTLSIAPFAPQCVVQFGSVYVGSVAELSVEVQNPTGVACVLHSTAGKRGLGIAEESVHVPAQGAAAVTLRWAPEVAGGIRQCVNVRVGKGRTLLIVVEGVAQFAGSAATKRRPGKAAAGGPRRPLGLISGNASGPAFRLKPAPLLPTSEAQMAPIVSSNPAASELLPKSPPKPRVAPEVETRLALVRLLSCADSQHDGAVVRALQHILPESQRAGEAAALLHAGLLPPLLGCVFGAAPSIAAAALRVLASLACTEEVAQAIVGLSPSLLPPGTLDRIVELLDGDASTANSELTRDAALTVSNLAFWPACRASLCRAGAVAHIANLLDTRGSATTEITDACEQQRVEAQRAGARALYSLAFSPEGRSEISSLPAERLRALYEVATDRDSKLDATLRRELAKAMLRERLADE